MEHLLFDLFYQDQWPSREPRAFSFITAIDTVGIIKNSINGTDV